MENIKYDVFLSRKSEDAHMAKEIYDFLTEKGLKVFDSDYSLQEMGNADYSEAIDNVLVNSDHIILLSSSIENINSPYVKTEWRFFVNRIRSGKVNGAVHMFLYMPTTIFPRNRMLKWNLKWPMN